MRFIVSVVPVLRGHQDSSTTLGWACRGVKRLGSQNCDQQSGNVFLNRLDKLLSIKTMVVVVLSELAVSLPLGLDPYFFILVSCLPFVGSDSFYVTELMRVRDLWSCACQCC